MVLDGGLGDVGTEIEESYPPVLLNQADDLVRVVQTFVSLCNCGVENHKKL